MIANLGGKYCLTSESVKQELGLRNNRLLEINIGFILLSIFTTFSVVSAILFINHIWLEDYQTHYKVIFAFELVKLVLITFITVLLYFGFTKFVHSLSEKSRLAILFTKISFSSYLVVYYVLSVIYLMYSFDHMSSEDVADILGKDLVSMLVLTISFFLLSLLIHREIRNRRSRLFLSFHSIFGILIIPISLLCFFLFTYNDTARQVNGSWQLYFETEYIISLSFLLFYFLYVIVSSLLFVQTFNRMLKKHNFFL